MTRTRVSKHALITRAKFKDGMKIFGRRLTHRVKTYTYDNFGQLSDVTTSDTEFTGCLQTSPDLDPKYLQMGLIEVGDGVLFISNNELSTLPVPEDIIVDNNSEWEVINRIKSPELGGVIDDGSTIFYSFSVRRRAETSDA